MPTDLPIRAETHPHWVEMLHRPHRATLIYFAVALLLSIGAPNPWVWLLVVSIVAFALFRWHVWQGEHITLTNKRIIRKQGVAETDWSESSLRIDRISGVWVVQTVWGKLLGYASIEIEAPGSHPATHTLRRLADPQHFYETLRWLVFGDPRPGGDPAPGGAPPIPPDPDDDPQGYVVAMGRPADHGWPPADPGWPPAAPPGSRAHPGRPATRAQNDDEEQYVTQPLPALPARWPRRVRRTP